MCSVVYGVCSAMDQQSFTVAVRVSLFRIRVCQTETISKSSSYQRHRQKKSGGRAAALPGFPLKNLGRSGDRFAVVHGRLRRIGRDRASLIQIV
jgi:hypothetical protein